MVDTGAQANLIRDGVVPSYLTKVYQKPLELVAANVHLIPGGDRETKVTLFFARVEATGQNKGVEKYEADFHVANIGVDAILSYPWLKSKKSEFYHTLVPLFCPTRTF